MRSMSAQYLEGNSLRVKNLNSMGSNIESICSQMPFLSLRASRAASRMANNVSYWNSPFSLGLTALGYICRLTSRFHILFSDNMEFRIYSFHFFSNFSQFFNKGRKSFASWNPIAIVTSRIFVH
jgi:hypothetical protein